jgi:hypothetical protein
MEIKDNALIITFMEVDDYENTFTYIMEEDSEESMVDIYKAFVRWCCGLDTHTKSIFENSDLWYELRNQILDQTYEINNAFTDDATFSVTKNGVAFNGTLGFTYSLNKSPFTHTVTLSGGLTIEMYDQFLDYVVNSERTFRMIIVNPTTLEYRLPSNEKGF